MFASGVGVAAPESVPRGSESLCVRGVGSITRVRFGSGEDGKEGGSWKGAGVVEGSSAIVQRIWMECGEARCASRR
jgi:hypothetical protein